MNNILQTLQESTTKFGDKDLLVLTDKTYTYKEFDSLTKSIMNAILSTDYKRGDRVAVIIDEFDYFYASMFALWRVGAVSVPLNASLGVEDLQKLTEKSSSSLLLITDSKYKDININQTLFVNNISDKADLLPCEPLNDDDIAVIMFTSGTTGLPKGVVQTLRSQSDNAALTCAKLGLTGDDRVLINTPPYFTSGLSHFTTMINAGGSLAGYKGFVFGRDLLEIMEKMGATGFGGAPAHLIRVVETMQEKYENSQIHFWMSSGDHLPKNVIEKTRTVLPNVKLFNVYGLTEVSGRLCILQPKFAVEKHGSVGTPIGDMKVTVIDAEGNTAPANEIGEIHVNGPLLLQEYLDAPDITAKSINKYGFKTGDFGYMDEDGFVFIEGRKDDIFKRGGEKVSTNKIKQVMLSLDMFKDVAVVAKDDQLMGKVPVACVVMKEDIPFKKIKILKQLKAKLPGTYLPANILNLDEIPRTGSGKAKLKEILKIVNN